MFAIIAAILALFAWFEIAFKVANLPAFITSPALIALAIAGIAADLYWPWLRSRRAPRQ